MPILSMRDDIVSSDALDYSSLQVGTFVKAVIEEVITERKCIVLRVNEFVKGFLYLDHMSDHPLKTLPPKFTQVGKSIKVRVFSVDQRTVEFTKKESLMKEKCPVFNSYDDVKKGDKIISVIVD